MGTLPISGCLLVQDEEKYIERAIRNLLPHVAEVVVLDGGSKDRTVELARNLGAKIFFRKHDFDMAAQRNAAMAHCENDWVLWCDADEWFDDRFYKLLPTLVPPQDPETTIYYVHRISRFDGQIVGEDLQPRLMRKSAVRWNGKTHEGCIFQGKPVNLTPASPMWHEHSMRRQFWTNRLLCNIAKGIFERPADNEGAAFDGPSGEWRYFENDRNG